MVLLWKQKESDKQGEKKGLFSISENQAIKERSDYNIEKEQTAQLSNKKLLIAISRAPRIGSGT